MPHSKSSNVRLTCSLLMVTLALISLILLRVQQRFFWPYTTLIAFVIALICIGQCVYTSFNERANPARTFWRQIFYWSGGLSAVYINVLMRRYGMIDAIQSGLFTLLLLALILYLIGLSQERTLSLIGATLGLMITGSFIIRSYPLLVVIAIAIIMMGVIIGFIKKNKATN